MERNLQNQQNIRGQFGVNRRHHHHGRNCSRQHHHAGHAGRGHPNAAGHCGHIHEGRDSTAMV
eukprot:8650686-Ditylum_brightwellii.AAC.1